MDYQEADIGLSVPDSPSPPQKNRSLPPLDPSKLSVSPGGTSSRPPHQRNLSSESLPSPPPSAPPVTDRTPTGSMSNVPAPSRPGTGLRRSSSTTGLGGRPGSRSGGGGGNGSGATGTRAEPDDTGLKRTVSVPETKMSEKAYEDFRRWAFCIAIVNFDIDQGPDLDNLYPYYGHFSSVEKSNIAFSSFPDSSDAKTGSMVFSWRIRRTSSPSPVPAPVPAPTTAATTAATTVAPSGSGSNSGSTTGGLPFLGKNILNRRSVPIKLPHSHHDLKFGRHFRSESTTTAGDNKNKDEDGGGSRLESKSDHTESKSTAEKETVMEQKQEQQQQVEDTESPDPYENQLKEHGDGFLYGYVWFTQEKDESSRRGYLQRSVVLITHLPNCGGLFSHAISLLGPLHYKHGSPMIEAATSNISRWPDPTPGSTLDFAFLGVVRSAEFPLPNQPQFSNRVPVPQQPLGRTGSTLSLPGTATTTTKEKERAAQRARQMLHLDEPVLLASNPFSPLTPLFHTTLSLPISKLILLWELILLGEPILVYSSDPRSCSELVCHLKNMTRPIPFEGDWRPYFHLHDPDFNSILNNHKPQSTIIGCTNPLILTTCHPRWPHVLKTGTGKGVKSKSNPKSAISSSSSSKRKSAPTAGGLVGGAGVGGPSTVVNEAELGLFTNAKRRLHRDPNVTKAFEDAITRGDYIAADSVLMHYFAELTTKFLVPLNRYFATLLPVDDSPTAGRPRKFETSEFLAQLKQRGAGGLSFKTKVGVHTSEASAAQSFYKHFLKSPTFAFWLHDAQNQAAESEARKKRI